MRDKILVPVDGSESTGRTIRLIIENRDLFRHPLILLHVVNIDKLTYRMIPDFQINMIREHARKSGENILKERQVAFTAAGMATELRLELGSPREVICRIANEESFDLLIIGRRGMGEIRDVLFGAVSNYVLHHVNCPVLLY